MVGACSGMKVRAPIAALMIVATEGLLIDSQGRFCRRA
jgi:hypothetical protein